jgi:hypothetical protein
VAPPQVGAKKHKESAEVKEQQLPSSSKLVEATGLLAPLPVSAFSPAFEAGNKKKGKEYDKNFSDYEEPDENAQDWWEKLQQEKDDAIAAGYGSEALESMLEKHAEAMEKKFASLEAKLTIVANPPKKGAKAKAKAPAKPKAKPKKQPEAAAKTKLCGNCGSVDHKTDLCPSMVCFVCKGKGHSGAVCPSKNSQ